MEFWKKLRVYIAILSGTALVAILAVIAVRQIDGATTSTSTQQSESAKADQPETLLLKGLTIDGTVTETPTQPPATAATPDEKHEAVSEYTYTAVAGDSYTALVRQAISQYATDMKLSLTADQQTQGEDMLVSAAGAPELEIGQQVTIAANAIANALGVQVSPASNDKNHAAGESKIELQRSTGQESSKTYTYTALSGDTYTGFVRKAMQEYLSTQHTALNDAQRVAAESRVVADAGTPQLAIGQQVTIASDAIKHAVEAASKLTTAQQAGWLPYIHLASL